MTPETVDLRPYLESTDRTVRVLVPLAAGQLIREQVKKLRHASDAYCPNCRKLIAAVVYFQGSEWVYIPGGRVGSKHQNGEGLGGMVTWGEDLLRDAEQAGDMQRADLVRTSLARSEQNYSDFTDDPHVVTVPARAHLLADMAPERVEDVDPETGYVVFRERPALTDVPCNGCRRSVDVRLDGDRIAVESDTP